MQSEIQLKTKSETKPKYPYLGLWDIDNSHFVVLFTEPTHGVIVHRITTDQTPENVRPVGHYSTNWAEHLFKPFTDKIVLFND